VSVLHGVIEARTDLPRRRGAFELSYSGDVYVVDAITNNPGAAGGAILTYNGKLLGMIGKQVRNAKTNTWVNYSLPIDVLSKSIEQIITGKFESSENQKKTGYSCTRALSSCRLRVDDGAGCPVSYSGIYR